MNVFVFNDIQPFKIPTGLTEVKYMILKLQSLLIAMVFLSHTCIYNTLRKNNHQHYSFLPFKIQRQSEQKPGKASVGTHSSSLPATARGYIDNVKCSALMCYQWQQSVSLLNDFLNIEGGGCHRIWREESVTISLGTIIQTNTKTKPVQHKKGHLGHLNCSHFIGMKQIF